MGTATTTTTTVLRVAQLFLTGTAWQAKSVNSCIWSRIKSVNSEITTQKALKTLRFSTTVLMDMLIVFILGD